MTIKAYLSLGSNIDDRYDYLMKSLKLIHLHDRITVTNVSSIYETDPVGYEEQNPFLNMAVEIKTSLNPYELLEYCLMVEKELGRVRDIRWGPRKIDIDILLYNQKIIEDETLVIPHPRMHEREFVLIPLTELDSTIIIPKVERNIKDILRTIPNHKGVRVWKQLNGEDVLELIEN